MMKPIWEIVKDVRREPLSTVIMVRFYVNRNIDLNQKCYIEDKRSVMTAKYLGKIILNSQGVVCNNPELIDIGLIEVGRMDYQEVVAKYDTENDREIRINDPFGI